VELGVGSDRIETISYGEEKPAVPGATTETQHARNRRAEFVIGVRR
jgi:peptidoglycan-associated lipoprotein